MLKQSIAKIHIICKNKKRGFIYPSIWDSSLKNLSEGTGDFAAVKWLQRNKQTIIEKMGVCDKHCHYEIKFRNEKNKLDEAVLLTQLMNDFCNPLTDKLCLKIADESCDHCLIERFGSEAAGNKKRKNKKKENNKKKAKKSKVEREDESDSEDVDIEVLAKKYRKKSIVRHDDYSTASDEYDSEKDKSKKKKKTSKNKKNAPEFDAKIWGRFYNAVDLRFGTLLTEPGVIEASNFFISIGKITDKLPQFILKKFGKPIANTTQYSTSMTHMNMPQNQRILSRHLSFNSAQSQNHNNNNNLLATMPCLGMNGPKQTVYSYQARLHSTDQGTTNNSMPEPI